MTRWDELPLELLVRIFTYLDRVEVASLVCKAWHKAALVDNIYKHVYLREFGAHSIDSSKDGILWFDYYKNRVLTRRNWFNSRFHTKHVEFPDKERGNCAFGSMFMYKNDVICSYFTRQNYHLFVYNMLSGHLLQCPKAVPITDQNESFCTTNFDEGRLVIVRASGSAILWDTNTAEYRMLQLTGAVLDGLGNAWLFQNKLLITKENCECLVFDIETGRLLTDIAWISREPDAFAYHGGKLLVVCTDDVTVDVLDLEKGVIVQRITLDTGESCEWLGFSRNLGLLSVRSKSNVYTWVCRDWTRLPVIQLLNPEEEIDSLCGREGHVFLVTHLDSGNPSMSPAGEPLTPISYQAYSVLTGTPVPGLNFYRPPYEHYQSHDNITMIVMTHKDKGFAVWDLEKGTVGDVQRNHKRAHFMNFNWRWLVCESKSRGLDILDFGQDQASSSNGHS
eukprot:Colp12_sorted_trinity150504_noHs@11559